MEKPVARLNNLRLNLYFDNALQRSNTFLIFTFEF